MIKEDDRPRRQFDRKLNKQQKREEIEPNNNEKKQKHNFN